MPDGGTLRVEFTGPHDPSRGPVPTLQSPYVTVALADSGPGVPPDRKEKIFWAYETSRPQGTGLGLAIVRLYMSAMGGEVVEDGPGEEGHGARFRLAFPIPLRPEVKHALGRALLDDTERLERQSLALAHEFGMERDPAARYKLFYYQLTRLRSTVEFSCNAPYAKMAKQLDKTLQDLVIFLGTFKDLMSRIVQEFQVLIDAVESGQRSPASFLSAFQHVRKPLFQVADKLRTMTEACRSPQPPVPVTTAAH